MNTLDDDHNDFRSKQIAQAAESMDYTSQRMEVMMREWQENQRWQLNQIREEVKAISKIAAVVGIAVLTAAIIYIKQAMNW